MAENVAHARSRQQRILNAAPSVASKHMDALQTAKHTDNADVEGHAQSTASQIMAHGDVRVPQASRASSAAIGTTLAQRQEGVAPHAAQPAARALASRAGASSTSVPRASTSQVCTLYGSCNCAQQAAPGCRSSLLCQWHAPHVSCEMIY